MLIKVFLLLFIILTALSCDKEINSVQDGNSLTGVWILDLVTDENNNRMSTNIEGTIIGLIMDNDGTGEVSIITDSSVTTHKCTWNADDSQLQLSVEGKRKLVHQYEVWVEGNKFSGEPPKGAFLLLFDDNQFTDILNIQLVFYLEKS